MCSSVKHVFLTPCHRGVSYGNVKEPFISTGSEFRWQSSLTVLNCQLLQSLSFSEALLLTNIVLHTAQQYLLIGSLKMVEERGGRTHKHTDVYSFTLYAPVTVLLGPMLLVRSQWEWQCVSDWKRKERDSRERERGGRELGRTTGLSSRGLNPLTRFPSSYYRHGYGKWEC